MTVHIRGIGTATPHGWIQQTSAAEFAATCCVPTPKQSRLLTTLYRRSKVDRRHSVILDQTGGNDLTTQDFYHPAKDVDDCGPSTADRMAAYEECATELAVSASLKAIAAADVPAHSITHLVSVSCTGFNAPGFDLKLIKQLGMSPEVARTHIGFMGCHAAMNAVRVASALAASDPANRVLICATELCSLHHQYGWAPENIVSNSLFADGAAAMLIDSVPVEADRLTHLASGSCIIPDTEDMMTWKISDHGFKMTLSSSVPDTIRSTLKPWLAGWLGKNGCELDEIAGWAVHPGGTKIIDAVQDSLALDPSEMEASRFVLSEYGNMSSPTVLFVMQRLLETRKNGHYVMLGFGPGLAIEAALLHYAAS